MNEKKVISRLSVFIFGAMVFIIGIYHTFLSDVYWLSYILSASASFLSGIFLRKNSTSFKIKSIIYMSSMFVMFPVFNFYIRKSPLEFCFVFPIVIYIMFLAGHSLTFKGQKVKSFLVLLLSLVFISSSYFYVPYFLFRINEKVVIQPIKQVELLSTDNDTLTSETAKGKVILLFHGQNIQVLDKIAEKFINNEDVLISYIFRENEFYHNLSDIKSLKFGEKYKFKVLFDKDNQFFNKLNYNQIPGAVLIDKKLTIRRLYMNKYYFFGNYYSRKIIEEINSLLDKQMILLKSKPPN